MKNLVINDPVEAYDEIDQIVADALVRIIQLADTIPVDRVWDYDLCNPVRDFIIEKFEEAGVVFPKMPNEF